MQKSYQPDLKVEPTKQMRHQMEKKRKKEQERRKMFKAERMQQDKMSHVSIFHCSHMHHYICLLVVARLLFGWSWFLQERWRRRLGQSNDCPQASISPEGTTCIVVVCVLY